MVIAFTYSLKDLALDHTDEHAEYESPATIEAIRRALSLKGNVIPIPCDRNVVESLVNSHPDVVFNIAEGWGGRDRESFVPAVSAALGVPCSGSDAAALGLTMDKTLTKRVLRDAGVRTPDFMLLHDIPSDAPPFGFPAFVKPNCDGSSRGVTRDSLVRNLDDLSGQVSKILLDSDGPALVEPYLDGRDFCAGLLGNSPPLLLRTCEVLLGHEEGIPFFSREYKRRDTDLLDMNLSIDPETIREMERMAMTAWEVIGCRDYARIDFRTDSSGSPHLLEVNALPGLSPVSGILVRQAEASGIRFDSLIHRIFERAEREASSGKIHC